MKYEGSIYRPPSEANSIIIQVTIGCSHNKCTFCSMYKDKQFRIRDTAEIINEIVELSEIYDSTPKKFFLADGDALILKTAQLEKIILTINKYFPNSTITTYTTPNDILNKSAKDLNYLHTIGLKIVYMGIESGSDQVLKNVCKGVTSENIVEAGKKIKQSGIKLSVMIISGLGGTKLLNEHAIKSAEVINSINPDYLSLLTLMINEDTKLYQQIKNQQFELLSANQIMQEAYLFINNLDITNCIFRSNHASNYVSLAGTFPSDKQRLLTEITLAIDNASYKSENYRAL